MLDAEDTTTTIKLERNKLYISQDPAQFGFWKLSLDRGALPEEFTGRYTKRHEAQLAAARYVARKTKD